MPTPDSTLSGSRRAFALVQAITLARFPLSCAVAGLLLGSQSTPVLIASLALMSLAELTDAADGMLARRWKVGSEFGATLDPFIDSVSRIIVFWGFAQVGFVWQAVPLVMALRDITVAYCRIIWARHGRSSAAKWSGKAKAIVQAVAAFAALAFPLVLPAEWRSGAAIGISLAVILATAYSGFDYARSTLAYLRQSAAA